MPELRRSTRHRGSVGEQSLSGPSGSEYHGSNDSMNMDDDVPKHEQDDEDDAATVEPPKEMTTTRSGRRVEKKVYRESDTEEGLDEDEMMQQPRRATRSRPSRSRMANFIDSDGEDEESGTPQYEARNRNGKGGTANGKRAGSGSSASSEKVGGTELRRSGRLIRGPPPASASVGARTRNSTRAQPMRRTRSSAKREMEDEGYVDRPSSEGDEDADASFENAPETDPEDLDDADADADADGDVIIDGGDEGEVEEDIDPGGRPYGLRKKPKINYAVPLPLEEIKPAPPPKRTAKRSTARKGPGWSATGAELDRWFRGANPHAAMDDSVRECPTSQDGLRTPWADGNA
jgi:ATPase family AAA domain-containing protein 2